MEAEKITHSAKRFRRTDEQTVVKRTERRTDRRRDKQTDRRADGQTDEWLDRLTFLIKERQYQKYQNLKIVSLLKLS